MARPTFSPTIQQRNQVRSFAAFGIPHEEIVKVLGIKSAKTLRKYFREELDRGAVEANSRVAQSLYNLATQGNVTAAIFWLKCRANWHERLAPAAATVVPPAFVVSEDAVKPRPNIGDESR